MPFNSVIAALNTATSVTHTLLLGKEWDKFFIWHILLRRNQLIIEFPGSYGDTDRSDGLPASPLLATVK